MEPGAFSPTLLASRHARNTPPRSKMLPGSSCCMVEFLPQDRLLVGCERAADLRQHLGRRDRLRPPVGVGCQVLEALTLVGVGDRAAQGPPQPLDAVGVGVVGGGVDQHQLLPELLEQGAQQPRPLGRVDAQVVQDHHGDLAASLGAGHRAAQLGDQRRRAAPISQLEVQPPLAPVNQPKATPLVVLAGRLDPPLAGPPGAGPHPGQGRVQGDLDLLLHVQVPRPSSPSSRGRSSGNNSSVRVASGTRSAAGGGSGDAAAARSASTLRRFLPTPGWAWALRESTQRGGLHTYPARCRAIPIGHLPAAARRRPALTRNACPTSSPASTPPPTTSASSPLGGRTSTRGWAAPRSRSRPCCACCTSSTATAWATRACVRRSQTRSRGAGFAVSPWTGPSPTPPP